jgi:two-component system, NarL family, response regulator LiaR
LAAKVRRRAGWGRAFFKPIITKIKRYKHIIIYGASLALLLMLLKWLEWHFVVLDHALDIYSGAIAIVFTGLGIWLALKLARPKTVFVERPGVGEGGVERRSGDDGGVGLRSGDDAGMKQRSGDDGGLVLRSGDHGGMEQGPSIDEQAIAKLGLSVRELEVLQAMAEGLSNQEIAARLFVSLNTVKTHSSNIFGKLDVRRRTQAVETAWRLKLISVVSVVPK